MPGLHGITSQFTRLEFLDNYDARFVIVTNGPIDEALAYKAKVGNKMEWYSSAGSSFGADVDAPPRVRDSESMSFCATAIPSTAPGTPTDAAPSNSATRSPHRPAAVGPAGGVAGLPPRRLAATTDVLRLGRVAGHCARYGESPTLHT